MNADTNNQYVFVVGLPRTGTKLVRNILQNSKTTTCIISPETWFFGDLFRSGIQKKIRSIGNLNIDANIHILGDYLFSGSFRRTYWILLADDEINITKEKFVELLLKSDRSDKAIYCTIMKAYAFSYREDIEGAILGDKTPGHLYYIEQLRLWFPDAKIIHTFRDPRAIAASEWKRMVGERPKTLANLLTNWIYSIAVVLYVSITWLYAVRLHAKYSRLYPNNYLLSKYEDLVTNPEKNTQILCDFIGIETSEEMQTPKKVNSSFVEQKGAGFDKEAINRWQSYLKPWIKLWLKTICNKYLKQFDYK